ncbi:hypothetical protein IW261DRAFT_1036473 [Armillaria novae-zelandiae]|uniref:Uncharacterized protein n=1 Tax=Armillaria novae-zelandiae TaxID=153914 RepID=A0AA39PER6_9AGAR|nr:hypothetical protein IW261DRAFT_1036473 [Armillaria novae-zelandiae]
MRLSFACSFCVIGTLCFLLAESRPFKIGKALGVLDLEMETESSRAQEYSSNPSPQAKASSVEENRLSLVKALARLEVGAVEALGQAEAGRVSIVVVLRSLEAGRSASTCPRKCRRQNASVPLL